MANQIDPVQLAAELIRCPSVTPRAEDAMALLVGKLRDLGFEVFEQTFSEPGTEPVPNFYARIGTKGPNLCFAGHTDVVPVGAKTQWQRDPFAGEISDGKLWGRGAADMKSAIASFVAAAADCIHDGTLKGSLSLLITGDEEGPAINGTRKVLEWIKDRGEIIDYCVVGEPTNPHKLGEMVKIGRRGSFHGHLTVNGTQGHVAYPQHAHNPIPDMVKLLATLEAPLDSGNGHFQPSNLEITTVDVHNDAHNVIPAKAEAHFNVRFSTEYTPESLEAELTRRLDSAGVKYDVQWFLSGDAFLTTNHELADAVSDAVEKVTNSRPVLSTTGGTSDARFIKDICPVVEFGLVGETMHKVDENVRTSDITALTDIYKNIIRSLAG